MYVTKAATTTPNEAKIERLLWATIVCGVAEVSLITLVFHSFRYSWWAVSFG